MYSDHDFARVHQIVRLRSVHGLNLAAIRSSLNTNEDYKETEVDADDGQGPRVGTEIRRLRLQKELTLSNLADQVGLSKSALSTLERTSRGVSVPQLRRIAEALGSTITELTASQASENPDNRVNRKGTARRLPSFGTGIQIYELASGPRMMDCQEWLIAPGSGSEGSYSHEGEEFIRVLEGTFEIEVDGLGITTLNSGDSIYFESSRPHSWRCKGNASCRVIWVNTPPTF